MGSIRANCPWCGRFGSLYSPDAVGYPICCGEDQNGTQYSCLWRHAAREHGAVLTAAKYTELALRRRFEGRGDFKKFLEAQWETIAKFVCNRGE